MLSHHIAHERAECRLVSVRMRDTSDRHNVLHSPEELALLFVVLSDGRRTQFC